MRDVRNAPRAHNLNLFLNLNQENQNNNFGGGMFGGNHSDLSQLLFNSPCKFFYSVDNSDWSEGIDINLMNPKKASCISIMCWHHVIRFRACPVGS